MFTNITDLFRSTIAGNATQGPVKSALQRVFSGILGRQLARNTALSGKEFEFAAVAPQ